MKHSKLFLFYKFDSLELLGNAYKWQVNKYDVFKTSFDLYCIDYLPLQYLFRDEENENWTTTTTAQSTCEERPQPQPQFDLITHPNNNINTIFFYNKTPQPQPQHNFFSRKTPQPNYNIIFLPKSPQCVVLPQFCHKIGVLTR